MRIYILRYFDTRGNVIPATNLYADFGKMLALYVIFIMDNSKVSMTHFGNWIAKIPSRKSNNKAKHVSYIREKYQSRSKRGKKVSWFFLILLTNKRSKIFWEFKLRSFVILIACRFTGPGTPSQNFLNEKCPCELYFQAVLIISLGVRTNSDQLKTNTFTKEIKLKLFLY